MDALLGCVPDPGGSLEMSRLLGEGEDSFGRPARKMLVRKTLVRGKPVRRALSGGGQARSGSLGPGTLKAVLDRVPGQ